MPDDLAPYLDWLREHGVVFEVARDLTRLPDHDGALVHGNGETRQLQLTGMEPIVEHRDTGLGLSADHATEMVAACLARPEVRVRGSSVWDIGCGTGVLMAAAGRLGAARIQGTDVDARALSLAERTLAESGLPFELFECSLMDTVPADAPADLLIANLPHKPCPPGFDLPTSQRGGPDGADPHAALATQALDRLPAGGQVLFFLHSLPDARLLRTYAAAFDLRLLAWKRRYFQAGEYGALSSLFEDRARRGASFLATRDGRRFLIAGTWLATRR